MNRRGFMGVLGIGAAAAPAVVEQMATNPVPLGLQPIGYQSGVKDSLYIDSKLKYDPVRELAHLKEDYSLLTADPTKWIADRLSQELRDQSYGYNIMSLQNIDPDIRIMKSISESSKIRMHIERRVKRQYELQKESLSMRIAKFVGITDA